MPDGKGGKVLVVAKYVVVSGASYFPAQK
jgi:hypothetical protein